MNKLRMALVGCAALIVMAATVSSARADDGKKNVTCRTVTVPVALAPQQAATYTVSGELCATADELVAGATAQVLIHGVTYNHEYWDFGTVDGIEYSYARDVAARGFPTFAIDQLGSGNSSRPPSEQLTIDATAFVVHQIVDGLRRGSIAGVQFGKVITVGHALGSAVAWQEAISFGDIDGVIITGAAHALSSQFQTIFPTLFYPAAADPKFAGAGLDSGYLTTAPGKRATLFYSSPDSDPAVTAEDEIRKDVVSVTQLTTGFSLATSNATLAIQVPVLIIMGGNDITTCGPNGQGGTFDCSSGSAVARQEAPFYSAQAQLHGCVIPGSGHGISLALNHGLQVVDAVAWSSRFVGRQLENNAIDELGLDSALPWNDGLPWNCGGVSPVLK